MQNYLTGTAANITSKILEYTVAPVGRQLGYLIFYGSNVNDLRSQILELEATKASLQHTIDQATRRGEEIRETVINWLVEANNISERGDRLLNDDEGQLAKTRCSSANYFFPNPVSRYKLSRRAKKMAQSVFEIKNACNFNNDVSYIPIRQNIIEMKGDYMEFRTRSPIKNSILEALRTDEIRSVGVYGMAGIGKTTLVKAVAKDALHAKLFSDAVEVAVSQSPNFENIQQDIADRLGLKFEAKGFKGRAVELRHRLKKEEKFLVILDDVWKKLDLLDIGIAFENHQKGCKILLTSRSQDVLRDEMGVKNNFEVELLSESEAWTCFSNIVGDDLLSDHNNHELATQIVKECACLPLAIVTVAGALKNKDLHAWKDALHQLKSSVNKDVSSRVRLSYDFLKIEENAEGDGDQLQKIFLFCSLREEDANIYFQELLNLVVGWGLFQNVYTLESARYRLQTLLDKLKSHGLLLNGTYENSVKMHDIIHDDNSVKMHDIIRDVGITIASEDPNNMYNIRSNDELKKCLDNDKLRDAVAISLGANYEDQSLPPRLKCSKLHLLWMWRKNSLLPEDFFEETRELRVLNLSHLYLKPLPPSFSFLQNLQALHLCFAELGDIDSIGELKKLKVLDLRGSTLVRLAEQIGQLSCLQVLNLENCRELEVIPPNVISRLVSLEELNMKWSFSNWKVDGVVNGEENNVGLNEIKNLSKLTTLYLNIPEANMLPRDLFSTELERFWITLGSSHLYSHRLELSRTLELNFKYNISRLLKENGFKMLLKRSEELYIYSFHGLKNLVFELDREEGLPHLKHLKVRRSDEIQYIIESMEHIHSNHNVLPSLETFSLYSLNNLEKICFGELAGPESLGKLREAEVTYCYKLKSLLPLYIAKKLEKIEVRVCNTMEEVVTYSADHDHYDSIEFPKLKEMTLLGLPKLIGFCSECGRGSTIEAGEGQRSSEDQELLPTTDISASTLLFDEKVAFPSLESLHLAHLKFERIWSETSCNYKLRNLRSLKIDGCDSLKYLFSFPIARSLSQLERLEVSRCRDMEEILVVNSVDHIIMFPKLKFLDLSDLPNELINFFSETESCSDIHDQINSDSAATAFFKPKVIGFPSLETLKLMGMNMERLWLPDHQLAAEPCYNSYLQNLRKLFVARCQRLKYLFPFAIAQCLVQLQELRVYRCRDMEEILVVNFVDHIMFPKLKSLKLEDLPNELIKFCSETESRSDIHDQINYASAATAFFKPKVIGFPSLETLELIKVNMERLWLLDHQLAAEAFYNSHLQNLRRLVVDGCHRLKYLFPFAIAQCLVQLQELDVKNCTDMEEIVFINYKEAVFTKEFRQGTAEKIELFSSLQKISLLYLPNLVRFCRGYNDMEYLLNLKELVIDKCGKLTTFISNSTDEEPQEHLVSRQLQFQDQKVIFPKLKSLSLLGHSPLPQMVQHADHEEFLSNLVMLKIKNYQKLRKMDEYDVLQMGHDVPKLLMDILGSHQYGARATIFQKLECLQLEQCEKLKKLLMPSWGFQALTVLRVRSCNGMEYLLTPSTAKSLPLLKAMEICMCRGMREIIRAKDDDDDDDDKLQGSSSTSSGSLKNNNNIVFLHLELLVLNGLTSLTCFHSGNCALEFPKLSQLVVDRCEMRNFFAHVIVTAPKLHTFIRHLELGYGMRTELDSNDHVQVDLDIEAGTLKVDHDITKYQGGWW